MTAACQQMTVNNSTVGFNITTWRHGEVDGLLIRDQRRAYVVMKILYLFLQAKIHS